MGTRRTPKRKPGYYLILGILVVVALYASVRVGTNLFTIWGLSRTTGIEERLFEEQRVLEIDLQEELRRLESDSTYIEDIARREYGMIKDGEEVYELNQPSEDTEK